MIEVERFTQPFWSIFASMLLLALSMTSTTIAQTTSSAALEQRDGLWYERGSDMPFTGDVEDAGEMAGRIEEGIRVGQWSGWHENGEVAWTTDYDQGQQVHHAMYFETGQQRFDVSYRDGAPDGITRMWSKNGVLARETNYKAGQRDGSHTLWDQDGKLFFSANYNAGKLHGPAIWWFDNGQKRWETSYAEGMRNGTWIQWQRDGELFMQSEWKNGELVSRNNPHAHH